MNIVLGVLIVIFSTFIGYVLSERYRDRLKYYEDFLSFNNDLISSISYSSKTVLQLIDENNNNYFYKCLKEFFLKRENNDKGTFLNSEEKKYLKNYLEQIGEKNKEMQLQCAKKYQAELISELEISRNDLKKYKKTYIKLGFLIGVMIFILLI